MAMTGNGPWRYVLPVTMDGDSHDFPCGGFRDHLCCVFVDGRGDTSDVSEIARNRDCNAERRPPKHRPAMAVAPRIGIGPLRGL